ncbi:MAG: acyl-CoA dehydrogenase family protein [Anaerolineae bacterium]|nr:acyl-CoA dehydrogenase family protein [Anaerolineae bacterium]
MDFSIPRELNKLQQRTRRFIDEVVIPYEDQAPHDIEGWHDLRQELHHQARQAGLFLPQLGPEWGGLGLNWRECALIFEEAGRSLLGPQALNCAAPDEGNMHLLEAIATPDQKEKFLRPLAAGETRSCFSMTEPAPGAGSDPSLLQTTAEKRGDTWVINGTKWFITGAMGAAFTIVMARTDEVHGRHGATMFLVDTDNSGFRIIRKIKTMDELVPGGHCEVEFVDCEVDQTMVLGEVNKGFGYAQVRLGPARLTHCMRWSGAARRAIEYATRYALERESFGRRLADHQGIQWLLADSEIELHAARTMIWHTAWLLDQGEAARHETSMAKVFVSETVGRVMDRAVQICGALGISEDIPVSRLYRDMRPFRIYDGPSEVHRHSIARRLIRRAGG